MNCMITCKIMNFSTGSNRKKYRVIVYLFLRRFELIEYFLQRIQSGSFFPKQHSTTLTPISIVTIQQRNPTFMKIEDYFLKINPIKLVSL